MHDSARNGSSEGEAMMHRWLAMVLALGMLAAGASSAAEYPTRPIRVVVGAAPGGATDFVARTIAPNMSAVLGQPVVIENKGGAAGVVASTDVAKSPPDGYTVLAVFANFATFPSLQRKLGFDPEKDLVPVSDVATSALVLVVPPSVPAKSIGEDIAYAQQGNSLVYASPGVGSMGHLAAELFQSMSGVKMTHVPYKGGGPAIMGLLGGDVQAYFSTPPAAAAQVKAGKLRALGVTGRTRTAIMPDVPTIAETGLAGYEVSGWLGLFVPTGTPKPVIDALSRAAAEAAKDPEVQKTLASEGVTGVGNTPAEFAAEVQADIAKWRKVIEGSHIQLD
jgi:tripartite-type tricarboxylate transporter receptor subunit TctC